MGSSATVKERILDLLEQRGRSFDDDQLAAELGINPRQTVNAACRELRNDGLVERSTGPDGKLTNRRTSQPRPAADATGLSSSSRIEEDAVKRAVKAHLELASYTVDVAWGRQHGVDIEASRPGSRLIIEAKGEVSSQPQQTNYFIGALGELVQRMSDPEATYGLALPDTPVLRRLVGRLPAYGRNQLNLTLYWVSRTEDGLRVTEA